jgi:A/G-specific adenine glycosylase
MMSTGQQNKFQLADRLVNWFQASQRDLPWRRTKDPYHIWVSEIMLQQTRVDTVIPYFNRFISLFPTIEALAEADEADLLKAWEGLGYYSRVRNMQIAARMMKEAHGGKMPDTREEISKLRGIGPYTAGAVLSIAYGKPVPAVDGNVLRVMSRIFLLYDDIAKPAARVKVEQLIEGIIPEDAAGDFNQSLMELGALICTPRSPKCGACPVNGLCSAYAEGAVDELPVKSKAKKPRNEELAAYIIEGTGEHEGEVLLRRRPQDGLLARMWELPNEQLSFEAQRQFGLHERYYMDAEHVFSHIRWQMKVYVCKDHEADQVLGLPLAGDERSAAGEALDHDSSGQDLREDPRHVKETSLAYNAGQRMNDGGELVWVSAETWRNYALPNVFLRILGHYFADKRTS